MFARCGQHELLTAADRHQTVTADCTRYVSSGFLLLNHVASTMLKTDYLWQSYYSLQRNSFTWWQFVLGAVSEEKIYSKMKKANVREGAASFCYCLSFGECFSKWCASCHLCLHPTSGKTGCSGAAAAPPLAAMLSVPANTRPEQEVISLPEPVSICSAALSVDSHGLSFRRVSCRRTSNLGKDPTFI